MKLPIKFLMINSQKVQYQCIRETLISLNIDQEQQLKFKTSR